MKIVHSNSGSSISRPTEYCIRVCGRMDAVWSEWLQGMIVTVIEAQGQLTVTELRGQLPDQAALMGILEHLHNCAIPMISMVNMSVDPHRWDMVKR